MSQAIEALLRACDAVGHERECPAGVFGNCDCNVVALDEAAAAVRASLAPKPVPDGELLPCPFCGGTPYLHDIGDEEPTNAGARVVICGKCQSCSAVQWSEKEDATPHLIEKWNRRAVARAARGESK